MLLQVGVKIILKNFEGKVLLLKRNAEKYPGMKNTWDIPGGRIEPGTPLLENLKREIMEETSLVYTGNPILVCAQDILRPDKHVVRLTYSGEISGEPKLDEEHTDYTWVSLNELRTMEGVDEYLREAIDSL